MKIFSEKVYQKISQNDITNKIYNYLYSIYLNLVKKNNNKKEFYSRISEINIDDYIELNIKPDLNIVIIAIDCLRYSELSSHGYHLKTTPFLDSFQINLKAISTSPHTYSSVPSILTGLYPHNHGAIISGGIKNFILLRNFKKMKTDVISLPEILYFLGYEIYFASAINSAYYPLRDRVLYPKLFPFIKANIIFKKFKKWVKKKKHTSFFAYLQRLNELRILRGGISANLPNKMEKSLKNIKKKKFCYMIIHLNMLTLLLKNYIYFFKNIIY